MQIALLRSNTPRLWAPGRSAVQMHIVYCIIYNIITCICELDDVFVFVMCLWTSVFCLKLHGRHCRKNILPVMFGCPLSMSDSPRPPKNKVETTKRLVHPKKYQPWTRMAKEAVLQLKLKLTLCIRDSNEAYPKVRNQPSDGTFWSTTLHLHVLPRAAWVMLELLKVPPRIKSNLSYHSRVSNPALSRLSFVSRLELETNLREVSQWQRGPPPGWKHLLVLVLSHLRHF